MIKGPVPTLQTITPVQLKNHTTHCTTYGQTQKHDSGRLNRPVGTGNHWDFIANMPLIKQTNKQKLAIFHQLVVSQTE